MKKEIFCLAVAAIMLASATARATITSVLASADSTVDLTQPNTAFPAGELIAAKQGAPEATATDLRFFYAQFDLPSGLTGQDIATLNSTQLQLVRTGPNLSLTYYAYGVLDGVDTASADTYTWNDGVGYDPANDLVKFLSPDEISYYSDPAESVFVGTLSTATPGMGTIDFTSIPQSPTAQANLANLILDDTDGRITFYVGVQQNFAVTPLNTFASIENGQFTGPTLVLDYEVIPEPATALLAGGSLFALLLIRRRQSCDN
ncbi:hypothetical protein OAS39_03435 [Pirellulales bacterium]|nr:hypothetical protein [Pirellulales bacterium]